MDKARILVVEDQSIIAMDLKHRLTDMGYGVVAVVAYGEEAVVKAEELKPDLILMDIVLKGAMDGVQAAEQIRQSLDAPIIYLTAHSDAATLQRARLTAPYGYILKPFEDRELNMAIEIALYKNQMESRLRESERWLAATLNSIGEAVIATDTEKRVKFMNPVAEALTGWTQAEVLNRELNEVFKIIHGDTGERLSTFVTKALQGQTVGGPHTDTLLLTKAGRRVPIESNASPIHDERGHITGVVLTFRNIAERKRAEHLLQQSESRYRHLFENSPVAIWEEDLSDVKAYLDSLGLKDRPDPAAYFDAHPETVGEALKRARIVNVNQTAVALFGGSTKAEFLDHDLKTINVTNGHMMRAELLALLVGQTEFEGQGMGRRFDGQPLQMHFRRQVIPGHEHDWSRVLVAATDLTALLKAEAELRLRDKAIATSISAIAMADAQGVVMYANPSFVRMWGYAREAEVLGQSISDFAPSPDRLPRVLAELRQHGSWIGEFTAHRKDGGQFDVQIAASVVKDETDQPTHLMGSFVDITERKRAAAELAATNTQLEQAVWEASQLAIQAQAANQLKSEILANTSHELRTPLTGILGSLGVILEGLCDTREEEHSFILTAYQSSRSLMALINNLLDLAKIEAGKMDVEMRAVAVAELLAEVGALCRAQAMEKHLALHVAPAPQPPIWVQADPEKVRQILLNLVNNAIKFTERGEVDISLQADPRAGEAYVRVRDTGVGVAPDQQAKLFQPFVQADGTSTRRFGGTGLGLSLSRQLAELMGGQLDLHSAGLGQGCTLTLTLSLVRA